MILFFDTETTGLVNFKVPACDPSQPRLVQIGMIVCEDSGEEIFQFGAMVSPKDFVIPNDMVHGISHNKATLCGVGLDVVLSLFSYWMGRCDLHVCHNFMFDKTVMESELLRGDMIYLDTPHFCTMQSMTGVCKLRQATSNRYKWPKLQEAYQFVFGHNFDKAHDALADVRACKEIYFWLKNQNENPETGTVETQTIANHGITSDRISHIVDNDNPAHVATTLPVRNIDLIK